MACNQDFNNAEFASSCNLRSLNFRSDPCGICKAARVVAQRMSQGNIVETAASSQNNSYGNPQS